MDRIAVVTRSSYM